MFTKNSKGRIRGVKLYHPSNISNQQAIITLQSGRLTVNQIEAARRVISKSVKKIGTYNIHIKPSTSVSKKPSEVRMGKGKGAIDRYVSRVKSGQLVFTLKGIGKQLAYNALLKASRKLPIKVKIIDRAE